MKMQRVAIILFAATFSTNLLLTACDKPKEESGRSEKTESGNATMEAGLLREQITVHRNLLKDNANQWGPHHPERLSLEEKIAILEHELKSVTSYSYTQKKPAYSAEKEIEKYVIHVDMFSNHPRLAEYKKVLQIKHEGKLIASKEIFDTGGFASFYFLMDACNYIAILDGTTEGFIINKKTGSISEVDSSEIPRNFSKISFGRFAFDGKGSRDYNWVPDGHAEQIPCLHGSKLIQ